MLVFKTYTGIAVNEWASHVGEYSTCLASVAFSTVTSNTSTTVRTDVGVTETDELRVEST